ncbi:hypothetical protein L1987_00770 [Smallanthus sonchifolius]|uniref:Uncharacterized protein n=1 Tax=Smallanthus sonchifolius TaxID=185202 RepID=A0ACB9K3A0_9ASTR|nr:hypothetical protein L1987_00770 [Smallanthus sonchifolius]
MSQYSVILDTNGYPRAFGWQGEVLLGRLGPWNGLGFSGFPIEKENQIYSTGLVINDKEIYHEYELKSSVVQRVVLTLDGKTRFLHWIERIQDWIVYAEVAADTCDRFSICGSYGICSINKHPPCTCMQGFEPRNPEEWDASDWVSGCVRKTPLTCGSGDGFLKLTGVRVPDMRRSSGYISPEYAVHGRFSIKSDVFSFDVMMLEIISGKKNREFSNGDHRDNLLGHVS